MDMAVLTQTALIFVTVHIALRLAESFYEHRNLTFAQRKAWGYYTICNTTDLQQNSQIIQKAEDDLKEQRKSRYDDIAWKKEADSNGIIVLKNNMDEFQDIDLNM